MESFTSCYKNRLDKLNAYDCQYFTALFLVIRILLCIEHTVILLFDTHIMWYGSSCTCDLHCTKCTYCSCATTQWTKYSLQPFGSFDVTGSCHLSWVVQRIICTCMAACKEWYQCTSDCAWSFVLYFTHSSSSVCHMLCDLEGHKEGTASFTCEYGDLLSSWGFPSATHTQSICTTIQWP